MPTHDHDPRPIPEHSPAYDGTNAEQIISWVHQTMEHYEKPHQYIGYDLSGHASMTLRNPYVSPDRGLSTITEGETFTYSEKAGQILPSHQVGGPEILVHDHVRTVAETAHLRAAQQARGVSIPEPGRSDFVGRRAAAAYDSPTVTPGLAGSIARHPSGKYTASPSINPAKTVVHHPPRIH